MTVMSEFSESIFISSLNNPDTYKTYLNDSLEEILIKYINLIKDYKILYIENTKIINKEYYNYLFLNGIKTLNNVFLNTLLYTRNLSTANFYSQKSFYLYIEFISQIDNVNHSFLQLNGKDASLFVYKKTIYEIDNKYRQEYNCSDQDIFEICSIYTNLTYIFFTLIKISGNIEQFKDNIEKNFLIINSILYLIKDVLEFNYISNNKKNDTLIMIFISKFIYSILIQLKNQDLNLELVLNYLNILISKIKKYKIDENMINNISCFNTDNFINKSPKKVIDLFFKN